MTVTAGYDAFVSYSHAADGRLAPAVRRGLEQLTKPWYRLRALRVFLDETGLAVTPALWPEIAVALDRSEYLVVLASPAAADSKWVDREIEQWKATKPIERILLVVTEGELHWDTARGDFGLDRSSAVPPSLLGVFGQEPRWLAIAAEDSVVRLVDVAARQVWANLVRHIGTVNQVAFSPDGTLVASAGGDGDTHLWDIRPEAARQRLCDVIGRGAQPDEWQQTGPNHGDPPHCP